VLASAGTGPRTLYFSGHFDVVPAQHRDQFQPRVEGQNLFGRGSSDMKSGLAAMIYAAAAARDEVFSHAAVSASCSYPMKKALAPVGRAI
jgi:acetylornithine deacetylase/succinyl-diaminopimelate desuccinylase-like protein